VNVPVPTTVVWDPANNQFSFSAGTEIQALTYGDLGLSDALPPVFLVYDLRVSNVVANCSTAMRSLVTARFDFFRLAQ
jgi:hypothetical protein